MQEVTGILARASQAIAETMCNPSVPKIIADIELAMNLIEEFKKNIEGLPPSVSNVVKALF